MLHTFGPVLANPFSVQVDLGRAVGHPPWQRAHAAALEVLGAGGRAVLVGEGGSGKSMLLRELAGVLRGTGAAVCLIGRPGPVERGGTLLVDDADRFEAAEVTALCAEAGPVLLAGLPIIAERLPESFGPWRRIALERLSPEDVARFVVARLAAAGRPGLLEAEAVLELARVSEGVPRLVNTIGAAAVFLAGLEGAARVCRRHVEEAATDGVADEAVRVPVLPGLVPLGLVPPGLVPMAGPVAGRPAEHSFGVVGSYRGVETRRRVVLSGMLAVAGGLFAAPWLLRRQVGVVAGETARVAVAASSPVVAPVAALDEGSMPEISAEVGAAGHVAVEPGMAWPEAPAPTGVPGGTGMAGGAVEGDGGAASGLDAPALFRGPIFNETMGQGGRATLAIGRRRADGGFTARFEASQGLSGSGVLAGMVSETGRVTASGQLLMGRTPFLCDLAGMLSGDTLTGSASFVRPGAATVYRSRFSLVRA